MRHLLICLSLFLTTTCFGNVNVKPLPGMPFVNRTHPLARGLVGLWLFNEGSGNKVFDLSGNGNHLTTFVGSVGWAAGKYGPALNFPGVMNYVANSSATPAITTDVTIVCSVVSDIGNNLDQGLVRVYDTFLKIGNYPSLRWYPDVDGGSPSDVPVVVTAGVTYQIAVTHSGIVSNLYKDGTLIDTSSSVALDVTSDVGILIGAYNDIGIWDLDGRINYVYIYNRALSASEIALLKREPFCFMQGAPVPMYAEEAPPAGGGQVIMIQMTAIPLAAILSITLALVFSRRRK